MKLSAAILGLVLAFTASAAIAGPNCNICSRAASLPISPPPAPPNVPPPPPPPQDFTKVTLAALPAAVKACTSACLLYLTPGNYGQLTLANLNPAQMVTINLSGSTFTFAYIPRSSNLTIVGGKVIGGQPGGNQFGFCWTIDTVTNVTLRASAADKCPNAAFTITRSKNVTLMNWTVTASAGDGVDVSGDNGVVVSGGSYTGYAPTPAGAHADVVQMWSMTGFPLQNIQILNNTGISTAVLDPAPNPAGSLGMQGFDNFGDNGPTSNVTVTGNSFTSHSGTCYSFVNITGLTFQHNVCTNALPEPWKAQVHTTGSTGTIGPNTYDGVTN